MLSQVYEQVTSVTRPDNVARERTHRTGSTLRLSCLKLHDLSRALLIQDAAAALRALHRVVQLQVEVDAARAAGVRHLGDLGRRLPLHCWRVACKSMRCSQPAPKSSKPGIREEARAARKIRRIDKLASEDSSPGVEHADNDKHIESTQA